MCCYRDIKNYDRFNLVVQSLICLTVSQLKNIQPLIDRHLLVAEDGTKKATKINTPVDDEAAICIQVSPLQSKPQTVDNGTPSVVVVDTCKKLPDDINQWHLYELEKLLILVSKAFLLNFPLYIAYKHGVHSRLDDITTQEAQVLASSKLFLKK